MFACCCVEILVGAMVTKKGLHMMAFLQMFYFYFILFYLHIHIYT